MILLRNQIRATANIADGVVVPGNMNRHALLVSSNNVNRITLSFNGPAVLDCDITIPAGASPVLLMADLFGPAIKEEIHAVAPADGTKFGILDIFCPCDNVLDTKRGGTNR